MVARLAVFPAIDASQGARLIAAAALGGPVPSPWARHTVADYDAVIEHPDVEAVYIPLPNDLHLTWALRAADAGKHVLCEKPLAASVEAAQQMRTRCDSAGVLLAEAWMTPFDRRWERTFDLVADGLIGTVTEVTTAFTFSIGPDAAHNYRWRPEHGGGALLDVGIYCLGPSVRLWGAEPTGVEARVQLAASGVDAATEVELSWPGGQLARARCSFVDAEQQRLELVGTSGVLTLDGDAHTGGQRATTIRHLDDAGVHHISVEPDDPYRRMIDAFATAVRGIQPWPRPVESSIAMLELMTRIRDAAR